MLYVLQVLPPNEFTTRRYNIYAQNILDTHVRNRKHRTELYPLMFLWHIFKFFSNPLFRNLPLNTKHVIDILLIVANPGIGLKRRSCMYKKKCTCIKHFLRYISTKLQYWIWNYFKIRLTSKLSCIILHIYVYLSMKE